MRSTKLLFPGCFQISDKCCNFAATSFNILRHNDLYERLRHEINAEAHENAHRHFAARHYPISDPVRVRIPGQRRFPVRLAPHSQKCLSDVSRHLSVLERTIFRDLHFFTEPVCLQRQSDTSFQNMLRVCRSADCPRYDAFSGNLLPQTANTLSVSRIGGRFYSHIWLCCQVFRRLSTGSLRSRLSQFRRCFTSCL